MARLIKIPEEVITKLVVEQKKEDVQEKKDEKEERKFISDQIDKLSTGIQSSQEPVNNLAEAVVGLSKDTNQVINEFSSALNTIKENNKVFNDKIQSILDRQILNQREMILALEILKPKEAVQLVVNRDAKGFIMSIDIVKA